jgi:opacity protein-like surface antigen
MEIKYRKVIAFFTVAALSLALPLFVSAAGPEAGEPGFSIGPRAAYFKGKDADKGSWFAGAQARIHLSPGLGLEGSIDYRRNSYAGGVTIEGYPVQATLLVHIGPLSPVSPYLLGGAGWYFTQVEGPQMARKTDHRFGPHAGAGLELKMNESVSIDGSYRYIWLADVTTRRASGLETTYRDSGSMGTLALNFLF